jgi:hypothetical protein
VDREGRPVSDCPICGRLSVSEGEFCAYHSEAASNVRSAFEEWREAMDIEWKDYLEYLVDEEGIGKWAREVVQFLKQQDDS